VSDRWVIAMAMAAALGAHDPHRVPLWLPLIAVTAAVLCRWPWLLCLAAAVMCSALAQRALDGLDRIAFGPVRAEVTLLSDPVERAGALVVDVRVRGKRLEARAAGPAGDAIRQRSPGSASSSSVTPRRDRRAARGSSPDTSPAVSPSRASTVGVRGRRSPGSQTVCAARCTQAPRLSASATVRSSMGW
jgi:hypothetical protein